MMRAVHIMPLSFNECARWNVSNSFGNLYRNNLQNDDVSLDSHQKRGEDSCVLLSKWLGCEFNLIPSKWLLGFCPIVLLGSRAKCVDENKKNVRGECCLLFAHQFSGTRKIYKKKPERKTWKRFTHCPCSKTPYCYIISRNNVKKLIFSSREFLGNQHIKNQHISTGIISDNLFGLVFEAAKATSSGRTMELAIEPKQDTFRVISDDRWKNFPLRCHRTKGAKRLRNVIIHSSLSTCGF